MLAQLIYFASARRHDQRAQRRPLDTLAVERFEPPPEIVEVFARGRHQAAFVEAVGPVRLDRSPAVVDPQLRLIPIRLHAAGEGDVLPRRELLGERRAAGPDLGLDVAAGVGEEEVEVIPAVPVLPDIALAEQPNHRRSPGCQEAIGSLAVSSLPIGPPMVRSPRSGAASASSTAASRSAFENGFCSTVSRANPSRPDSQRSV